VGFDSVRPRLLRLIFMFVVRISALWADRYYKNNTKNKNICPQSC
jgi:hypothetical protein